VDSSDKAVHRLEHVFTAQTLPNVAKIIHDAIRV
jgi:hypothetical protein